MVVYELKLAKCENLGGLKLRKKQEWNDFHEDFLKAKDVMSKINYSEIAYSPKNNRIKDVECIISKGSQSYYDQHENIIIFGKKIIEYYDKKLVRFILVHELLHSVGFKHYKEDHAVGYYSIVTKDVLTKKIMKKIGWDVPEDEDWFKLRSERLFRKYKITCKKCDFIDYRQYRTELIRNIEDYHCPSCGNKTLEVKN